MNITNRITSATFSVCITNKDGLPKDDLPIIALVGRRWQIFFNKQPYRQKRIS